MTLRRTQPATRFGGAHRKLLFENLEERSLLASDWQNPFNPWDVDDSGHLDPRDALLVINHLMESGSHPLQAGEAANNPPVYVDVDGSSSVEPLDALQVINALNEPAQAAAPVQSFATQRFHANINTGVVTAVPLYAPKAGDVEGETVFAGDTIGFNLSTILSEPGDAGRKVINVTLTNQSGEPIGQTPDDLPTGVRVLFSPFAQFAPSADLRTRSAVSTFAGSGVAGSVDGSNLVATFNRPAGTIADGQGNVYVTDFTGNKIRVISGGTVTTLAGSGVAGATDGVGAAASLNGPYGIARNPVDGALFVTDYTGNRIRRIMPDGSVTTVAGIGSAGDANGTGNVASFRNPIGVAVDANGVIYVTEYAGQRVRKIVKTGSDPKLASSYTVSLLAGSAASPPVAGFANGPGNAARFKFPRSISVDASGVLYVADGSNNRLRRITSAGAVTTIAGTGVAGSANGAGSVATFSAPGGIAVVGDYSTTLLVSDISGRTIRQVTLRSGSDPNVAANWQVTTLAGIGAAGSADGAGDAASFDTPVGISVDGNHRAYIADYSNNKIRLLTVPNGFPSSLDPVQLANADGSFPVPSPFVASPQQPIHSGIQPFIKYEGALAAGATTPVQPWVFIVPSDVVAFEFTATVVANTRYLSPPFGVSNSDPSGVGSPENMVRTVAGRGLGGFVDGLATEARFSGLIGIAIDAAGNSYVADANNHAIRRITPDGFVSTVAGVVGKGAGSTNGVGTSAQFNSPSGIAIAKDGTIYVADCGNNLVRRIINYGGDLTSPASWYVSTIAGLAGAAGYVDNTTGDLARFACPRGIDVSDGNVVYVSEQSGNRVRRLQLAGSNPDSAASWYVSLVAGSTAAPTGTPGTTDGNGSQARFDLPEQIAVDGSGMIYVADRNNNRIRRITPDGQVWTLAGSSGGYADGIGTAAQFQQPLGIAVDKAGYVYVSDSFNQRIRRISPAGVVTTVAGRSGFGDADGTGDEATFYYPQGLAVDDSGGLHVTSGGQFPFVGGGSTTSPGLRIRLITRIKK